jgi:hypothetical protein
VVTPQPTDGPSDTTGAQLEAGSFPSRDDLTTDLQIRHVGVEIDPIQALQIQHHMPIEDVVHWDLTHHRHRLRSPV